MKENSVTRIRPGGPSAPGQPVLIANAAGHASQPQSSIALPSLETILNLPAFRAAELICGHSQINEPVTWVHIAEVLNVWRFLTGGELVLSTGLELLRASQGVRVGYIRRLAQAGVRALALELVQWITEVPEEIVGAARELKFPLVVFRAEVSFRELTQAAHQEILLPARHHGQESTMQTITHALIETRRDRAFVRSELGPLLALPPRPRNALLTTLEVLLDVHFNITAAARVLGIRRQTIYYRLDQLTGLLGSLDDPSRKLGFLVAFALLRREASQR
jgi:DNA-binding PucR family transcriptional regulator